MREHRRGTVCKTCKLTKCSFIARQVKGILSSGRAHQAPVNTAVTCGQYTLNGRDVPWVSTHTENHQQYYCWHTEKITAIDEDRETFFGRQVFLSECESSHGATSTCLMVSRGDAHRCLAAQLCTFHFPTSLHGPDFHCLVFARGVSRCRNMAPVATNSTVWLGECHVPMLTRA